MQRIAKREDIKCLISLTKLLKAKSRSLIIRGGLDTIALVARATVNFPSESSIVVYRKAYPISRETLAAYSLSWYILSAL